MNLLARAVVPLALISLPLTACGDSTSTSDASAQTPTVVTSSYPVQFLVNRLAGDLVNQDSLVTPGQEPHDVDISLKQTAGLADAATVIYFAEFQPAVDEAVETASPSRALDLAEVVDPLAPGETEADHAAHEDDGHEGEAGHEEDGHEEDSHDHGSHDPHFWLDPARMQRAADAIAAELIAVVPTQEATIESNLAALTEELTALDAAYTTGLDACEISTVVVSHDAFGYLAARYGLSFAGINGLSPNAEPSLAHLAQLRELVEEEGITTVFNEELASPEMADRLASDLDLTVATLDPLEGLSDATENEDYFSLMQGNLEALMKANQCSP